jgi:anti-anti-sigma factor
MVHDDYFGIARETVHRIADGPVSAVIRLGGEFDLGARDELRDVLLATVDAAEATLITVDMGDVTFLDSEAISAVVDGYLAAEQADIAFQLARADGIVKLVFEVLGLAHLFEADSPPGAAKTS